MTKTSLRWEKECQILVYDPPKIGSQWRIQDFPLGGRGCPAVGGFCQPLTRVLFGENVCENERIGSHWGVCATGAPGSADGSLFFKSFCWIDVHYVGPIVPSVSDFGVLFLKCKSTCMTSLVNGLVIFFSNSLFAFSSCSGLNVSTIFSVILNRKPTT